MDLLLPLYNSRDVIRAIGIDAGTLQSWLYRGYIDPPPETAEFISPYTPPAAKVGSGNRRLFDAWRVVMLAVTKELATRYGIAPVEGTSCAWNLCREVNANSGIVPATFLQNPCADDVRLVYFSNGDYSGWGRIDSNVLDIAHGQRSAIVLALGQIAIDVLRALDAIIVERKGGVA